MDTKEFKALATETCVEAITSTSKNLVEVVATKLKALHDKAKAEGMNEPLKFSKTEAERIAFDARVKFNKNKGMVHPKGIKYDQSSKGPFASFRTRELELIKIIQNIQFYDDAKTACDELVKSGDFVQTGASELTRAMLALGKGDSAETWKKSIVDKATSRKDTAKTTKDKAVTPEGFTDRLESLMSEAENLRIMLGEDGKTFEAMPAEKTDEAKTKAMPDSEPTVLDNDALKEMMGGTAFLNAAEPMQDRMMAAFMRR